MALVTAPIIGPSVTTQFPFELVEAILLEIDQRDLITMAASLPRFWRSVLTDSGKLSRHMSTVKRWGSFEVIPDRIIDRRFHNFLWRQHTEMGMLVGHRRSNGNEGFVIFGARAQWNEAALTILDPRTKIARFIEKQKIEYPKTSRARRSTRNRTENFGVLQLRDMDGNVRVRQEVGSDPQQESRALWYCLSTLASIDALGHSPHRAVRMPEPSTKRKKPFSGMFSRRLGWK